MPEKGLEEKEEEIEMRKILTKKLNKFFSDYFKWIIASVVFVVLAFGFFFLILPKYDQTMKFVNMANEQEKSDFQKKNEELSKIKELLNVYNSLDPKYIDKVEAIAPLQENKEELFPEINYLVSKNQLFLQSVSLGEAESYGDAGLVPISGAESSLASNIEVVSIEISVKGTDYESFKNFLSALENNLRLMDVININFDPIGKSANLIINTYYIKQ